MRYRITKNKTWEKLIYVENENAIAWIDSDKMHKYYEDSFLFTEEQVKDFQENLLRDEDLIIDEEEENQIVRIDNFTDKEWNYILSACAGNGEIYNKLREKLKERF